MRALWAAGDRALPLDVPLAEARYNRALNLMPGDQPDRPRLQTAWAEALIQCGRLQEAAEALDQAANALRAAGDRRAAAVVMATLQKALYWHDDRSATAVSMEAFELLEGERPSAELVFVLQQRAATLIGQYRILESMETAERAIRMASELELVEPHQALLCRGLCRVHQGDEEGIGDIRRSLTLALDGGSSLDAGVCYNDLADALFVCHGPATAARLRGEGLEFAAGRGNRLVADWLRVQSIQHALWTGNWDDALVEANDLEAQLADADDPQNQLELRWAVVRMLTLRGEPDKAEPLAVWAAERSRSQPDQALHCLPSLALVQVALGDRRAALATVSAVERMSLGVRGVIPFAMALSTLLRIAVQVGDPQLAGRLLIGVPAQRGLDSRTIAGGEALLAETGGRLEEAAAAYPAHAQSWHDFGAPYEEAQARLGLGRCLVALGRAPEAAPPLTEARTIFAKLGAKPALAETDALLSRLVNAPA